MKVTSLLHTQSSLTFFNIVECTEPFTLKMCSGIVEEEGSRAKDLIVESIDGDIKVPLPKLLECDMIPEDPSEIPSPEATHHSHLRSIITHKISH